MAHAVKREERSGIIGVHRVRSPMPPWAMTRVGPDPAHSSVMRVPSFDGTRVTCLSVVGRGAGGGEGLVGVGCAPVHPTKTTNERANASEERDILESSTVRE